MKTNLLDSRPNRRGEILTVSAFLGLTTFLSSCLIQIIDLNESGLMRVVRFYPPNLVIRCAELAISTDQFTRQIQDPTRLVIDLNEAKDISEDTRWLLLIIFALPLHILTPLITLNLLNKARFFKQQ